MNKEKNGVGYIKVQDDFFEEFWLSISKDIYFIPLEITHSNILREYTIIARSSLFDVIDEGAVIPEYKIIFKTVDGFDESFYGYSAKRIISSVERVDER